MKVIIASGAVIIEKGKLLVSKDNEDKFYKIPGGTLEEGEGLEDCAIRELKEETGFFCELIKKLSTMELNKKPGTEEEIKISLNHYLAKLINVTENYGSFNYEDHKVVWADIDEIKNGNYNVAPNIKFLIEKGDIK